MTPSIYDDPRTIQRSKLRAALPERTFEIMGHVYSAWDGCSYQVVGWRQDDGPWVEDVLRRDHERRTLSISAIGRTYHHHQMCPVKGCRAECQLDNARTHEGLGTTVAKVQRTKGNALQESDGKTIWITGADGCCLGRFSARGIDVHKDAKGQMEGEQCLYCQTPEKPLKRPTFEMYVRFIEKMKEHHGVDVARTLPIELEWWPRFT